MPLNIGTITHRQTRTGANHDPDQAERLRDLFMTARATTRESQRTGEFAADDAAVEAFNTALREYTTSENDALRTLGAVLHSAGGQVVVPMNAAVNDYEVSKADDWESGGYVFTSRRL